MGTLAAFGIAGFYVVAAVGIWTVANALILGAELGGGTALAVRIVAGVSGVAAITVAASSMLAEVVSSYRATRDRVELRRAHYSLFDEEDG